MSTQVMSFNDLRAEAKALGINTKNMSRAALEEAIAEKTAAAPEVKIEDTNDEAQLSTEDLAVIEAVATKRLGRPVVAGSARQIRLAEQAEKKAAGLLKRGRPVVEGSPRQMRLAAMEAKKAAGIEIKPGRPKMVKEEAPAPAPAADAVAA